MNGKIEIMLGGDKKILWFNNYAKGAIGSIYGVDPLEAGEKLVTQMQSNYMRGMADLIFAGLEGYHEATDTPKEYTKKDVLLWCADAEEEDVLRVFNTWLEFSQLRSLIKTEEKKDDKKEQKKRPGKKSSTSPSVS